MNEIEVLKINNNDIIIFHYKNKIYYNIEDIHIIIKKKINHLKIRGFNINWVVNNNYINSDGLYKIIFSDYCDTLSENIKNSFKQLIYDTECYMHDISEDLNMINSPCIYLLHLKDDFYKFGQTVDIKRRLNEHENDFSKYDIKFNKIKIWSCHTIDTIIKGEKLIKSHAKINKLLVHKYDKKEILKLEYTENIIKLIDNYVVKENDMNDPNKILKINIHIKEELILNMQHEIENLKNNIEEKDKIIENLIINIKDKDQNDVEEKSNINEQEEIMINNTKDQNIVDEKFNKNEQEEIMINNAKDHHGKRTGEEIYNNHKKKCLNKYYENREERLRIKKEKYALKVSEHKYVNRSKYNPDK